MEENARIKADFDKNLNCSSQINLELTDEEKTKLKEDLAQFISAQDDNIEGFISKERSYINVEKSIAVKLYLEKIISESDMFDF